jgi:hypothetical protein
MLRLVLQAAVRLLLANRLLRALLEMALSSRKLRVLRISRRRTRDLILPGNSLKRSPKETLLTYFAEDSRALVLTTLPLLMVLPSLALLAAVLDLVSLTFSSQATVVWERYCLIITFSPNFARLYIR